MPRLTDEELRKAGLLGIDVTHVSRQNLETVRTEIHGRYARLTKDSRIHAKLNEIAEQLGLTEVDGETIEQKERRIEAALLQQLQQKGIIAGARIMYRDDAPNNAGRQGSVSRLTINWINNLPHIPLHLDGNTRTFNYQAHVVVSYATVVA